MNVQRHVRFLRDEQCGPAGSYSARANTAPPSERTAAVCGRGLRTSFPLLIWRRRYAVAAASQRARECADPGLRFVGSGRRAIAKLATRARRRPVRRHGRRAEHSAFDSPRHVRDRQLRDVKEPGQVDGGDRRVVRERVLGERFADVDAGVVVSVSTRPKRASAVSTARCAVLRSAMPPATVTEHSAPCENDSDTPTTSQPARPSPATRPAPLPREAPVMIATGELIRRGTSRG
jgi:hypothetical protein